MTYINSIILGIVQGVAEFLPVSSSGHLVIIQHFMSLGEIPLLFDVLLHIATLLVVLIIFYKRIWGIVKSLFKVITFRPSDEIDRENIRLFLVIILATFFTGVLGLLIEKLHVEDQVKIVYALFIVTGVILLLARKLNGKADYSRIGAKHGIITGIAQGFGVLPGISRSGITISAALLSGMNREKAGEFSFLISLPAILGALVLQLKDAGTLAGSVSLPVIGVGMASAFVVGLLSLTFLIRLIKKGSLHYFSCYLIPLGLIGLIFF